jgi:hypothetical protein
MALLRPLALFFFLVALAVPAQAADVVFPPGSRVGLAPPPGMTAGQNFPGFEDRDNNVAIVIVALPAEAYTEIEKSSTAETMQKQGVTLEIHEPMTLATGKALLVVGRQTVENVKLRKWFLIASAADLTAIITVQIPEAAQSHYPDEVIRAALMSFAVRASVPTEEQLSLLPFRVTELAGFRVGGLLAGRAVMLTDAEPNATEPKLVPHMVVAIAPGGPSQGSERENFARDVFATIPNVKDVRIQTSESLRLAGQQAHQILAKGKDNATGTDITIVQWLRFGGGAYMQVFGVAPTDAWTPAYGRFRSVRDGIGPR